MKRIFYVVLVILILMVIGSFVKKGKDAQRMMAGEEVVVEDVVACDCDTPCECDEKDLECVCAVQRASCDCGGDSGDSVILDTNIEEVEEDDSGVTSHEDETIISE